MLFANIDFLCLKIKSSCLFRTKGAHNHIKQGDACFFARNAIGVTYDRPTAMFTSVIHDCLSVANKMPHRDESSCQCSIGKSVALTGYEGNLSIKQEMTLIVMAVGNSRRGLNSCGLIMYKSLLRELSAYFAGALRICLVQCAGKSVRLFNLRSRVRA